ncbi:hypothetical protein AVEN_216797-1 [Araneus ventricosus]|uniref:RNase H type-1 domain-containing protein n=1 Tax=Araneus ventricosus TaxID=182803 RepID=A0A4Y2SSE9_ARAVE|nr:hypothetical protein AVEN_29535-1 [Araneus ventricosus]GBN91298.1 hypothetical protein AVEN_216797-1 [Araneus ventricosus]
MCFCRRNTNRNQNPQTAIEIATLCRNEGKKKNKLKRASFSRSVGSVPARAARPAAHSPSKMEKFNIKLYVKNWNPRTLSSKPNLRAFGEAVDRIIENEKKINIYTDSRSSIEALKNYRSGSEFVISIVTIKIRRMYVSIYVSMSGYLLTNY